MSEDWLDELDGLEDAVAGDPAGDDTRYYALLCEHARELIDMAKKGREAADDYGRDPAHDYNQ